MDKRKKDITKLSMIAPGNKEQIKRWLGILGYDFVDFFDTKDDMQGYVAKNENGQVLIFRQSEKTYKDWANNLNVFEKEVQGKKYHAGYIDMILDNFDVVCDKLEDLNVVIGGFSQGGGLAEVISNYLNDTTGFNPWFANIDGPCVIKSNGYKNGIYTINSNSPIPISTIPFGYKHFGDLIYFTFRGRTYINPRKVLRKIDFMMQTGEDIIELLTGKVELEHNIEMIDKYWIKGIRKISKLFK